MPSPDPRPMHGLRQFVALAGLLAVAALTRGAAKAPAAAQALERLQAGNARFASDAAAGLPIAPTRRPELTKGHAPFATVLSCADSRVPPEIVFNQDLGDLFVVRAAGQVADRPVLASVEYAAEHLHTPLLVVMGHEFCGAVKDMMEAETSLGPNLDDLVRAIRPAVERTAQDPEQERLNASPQRPLGTTSGGLRVLNPHATTRHVGTELDVQTTYVVSRELSFGAGFGYLFSGPYLDESTGGGNAWAPYVMWNVRF